MAGLVKRVSNFRGESVFLTKGSLALETELRQSPNVPGGAVQEVTNYTYR